MGTTNSGKGKGKSGDGGAEKPKKQESFVEHAKHALTDAIYGKHEPKVKPAVKTQNDAPHGSAGKSSEHAPKTKHQSEQTQGKDGHAASKERPAVGKDGQHSSSSKSADHIANKKTEKPVEKGLNFDKLKKEATATLKSVTNPVEASLKAVGRELHRKEQVIENALLNKHPEKRQPRQMSSDEAKHEERCTTLKPEDRARFKIVRAEDPKTHVLYNYDKKGLLTDSETLNGQHKHVQYKPDSKEPASLKITQTGVEGKPLAEHKADANHRIQVDQRTGDARVDCKQKSPDGQMQNLEEHYSADGSHSKITSQHGVRIFKEVYSHSGDEFKQTAKLDYKYTDEKNQPLAPEKVDANARCSVTQTDNQSGARHQYNFQSVSDIKDWKPKTQTDITRATKDSLITQTTDSFEFIKGKQQKLFHSKESFNQTNGNYASESLTYIEGTVVAKDFANKEVQATGETKVITTAIRNDLIVQRREAHFDDKGIAVSLNTKEGDHTFDVKFGKDGKVNTADGGTAVLKDGKPILNDQLSGKEKNKAQEELKAVSIDAMQFMQDTHQRFDVKARVSRPSEDDSTSANRGETGAAKLSDIDAAKLANSESKPDKPYIITEDEKVLLREKALAVHKMAGYENLVFTHADGKGIEQVLETLKTQEQIDEFKNQYKIANNADVEQQLGACRCFTKSGAFHLQALLTADESTKQACEIRHALEEYQEGGPEGRSKWEIASYLRKTLSHLDHDQMKHVQDRFANLYSDQGSLSSAILSAPDLPQEIKESVAYYAKGSNNLSERDKLKLTEIAVEAKNLDMFKEVTSKFDDKTRQSYNSNDKRQERLNAAFSGQQLDQAKAAAQDSINVIAQEIRDNTGTVTTNREAVRSALFKLTDEQRQRYEQGRELETKEHRTEDEEKSVQLYQSLHGAIKATGVRAAELRGFEDSVALKGGGLISEVSKGDGVWVSGVQEQLDKIANMSETDWQKLHDYVKGVNGSKPHPEYRQELEKAMRDMKGFRIGDPEVTKMLLLYTKKINADSFDDSKVSGQKDILDALSSQRGVYNDRGAALEAISRMTPAEQKRYRNEPEYRKDVDNQLVHFKQVLNTDAYDQAQRMLGMYREDKNDVFSQFRLLNNQSERERKAFTDNHDAIKKLQDNINAMGEGDNKQTAMRMLKQLSDGHPPEMMDVFAKLAGKRSNWFGDAHETVQAMEQAFKDDPALLKRVQEPITDEDKRISAHFKELSAAAFGSDSTYGEQLIGSQDGRLALSQKLELQKHWLYTDRQGLINDLAGATDSEKQLLKDPNSALHKQVDETMRTWMRAFNGAEERDLGQQQVIQRVLKTGNVEEHDKLRSFILDVGHSSNIMELLKTTPPDKLDKLCADYEKSYHRDLRVDFKQKLSKSELAEALNLLYKPTNSEDFYRHILNQYLDTRSGFGSGFADKIGHSGTGYQLDNNINHITTILTDAHRSGKPLSVQQEKLLLGNISTAVESFTKDLSNFKESKSACAEYTSQGVMAALTVAGAIVTAGGSLVAEGGVYAGLETTVVGLGAAETVESVQVLSSGARALNYMQTGIEFASSAKGNALMNTGLQMAMLGNDYDLSAIPTDLASGYGQGKVFELFSGSRISALVKLGDGAAARTSTSACAVILEKEAYGLTGSITSKEGKQAFENTLKREIAGHVRESMLLGGGKELAPGAIRTATGKALCQALETEIKQTSKQIGGEALQKLSKQELEKQVRTELQKLVEEKIGVKALREMEKDVEAQVRKGCSRLTPNKVIVSRVEQAITRQLSEVAGGGCEKVIGQSLLEAGKSETKNLFKGLIEHAFDNSSLLRNARGMTMSMTGAGAGGTVTGAIEGLLHWDTSKSFEENMTAMKEHVTGSIYSSISGAALMHPLGMVGHSFQKHLNASTNIKSTEAAATGSYHELTNGTKGFTDYSGGQMILQGEKVVSIRDAEGRQSRITRDDAGNITQLDRNTETGAERWTPAEPGKWKLETARGTSEIKTSLSVENDGRTIFRNHDGSQTIQHLDGTVQFIGHDGKPRQTVLSETAQRQKFESLVSNLSLGAEGQTELLSAMAIVKERMNATGKDRSEITKAYAETNGLLLESVRPDLPPEQRQNRQRDAAEMLWAAAQICKIKSLQEKVEKQPDDLNAKLDLLQHRHALGQHRLELVEKASKDPTGQAAKELAKINTTSDCISTEGLIDEIRRLSELKYNELAARPRGYADTTMEDAVVLHKAFEMLSAPKKELALVERIKDLETSLEKRRNECLEDTKVPGTLSEFGFECRVAETIKNAKDSDELIIAFVDLNNFKNVNVYHSMEMGDQALREWGNEAAKILEKHGIKPSEALGHFGGDEFGIVLKNQPNHAEILNEIMSIRVGCKPKSNDPTLQESCDFVILEKGEKFSQTAYKTEIENGEKVVTEHPSPVISATLGAVRWKPDMTVEDVLQTADKVMFEKKPIVKQQLANGDDAVIDPFSKTIEETFNTPISEHLELYRELAGAQKEFTLNDKSSSMLRDYARRELPERQELFFDLLNKHRHTLILDRTKSKEVLEKYIQTAEKATAGADGKVEAPFTIIRLSIDNFKPVNDTMQSHAKGNQVLRAVGKFLRNIPEVDFVGSLGGTSPFLIVKDPSKVEKIMAECDKFFLKVSREHARPEPLKDFTQAGDGNIAVGLSAGKVQWQKGMGIEKLLDVTNVETERIQAIHIEENRHTRRAPESQSATAPEGQEDRRAKSKKDETPPPVSLADNNERATKLAGNVPEAPSGKWTYLDHDTTKRDVTSKYADDKMRIRRAVYDKENFAGYSYLHPFFQKETMDDFAEAAKPLLEWKKTGSEQLESRRVEAEEAINTFLKQKNLPAITLEAGSTIDLELRKNNGRAFYRDGSGKIAVRTADLLNEADPTFLATLYHEMVHAEQDIAMIRACGLDVLQTRAAKAAETTLESIEVGDKSFTVKDVRQHYSKTRGHLKAWDALEQGSPEQTQFANWFSKVLSNEDSKVWIKDRELVNKTELAKNDDDYRRADWLRQSYRTGEAGGNSRKFREPLEAVVSRMAKLETLVDRDRLSFNLDESRFLKKLQNDSAERTKIYGYDALSEKFDQRDKTFVDFLKKDRMFADKIEHGERADWIPLYERHVKRLTIDVDTKIAGLDTNSPDYRVNMQKLMQEKSEIGEVPRTLKLLTRWELKALIHGMEERNWEPVSGIFDGNWSRVLHDHIMLVREDAVKQKGRITYSTTMRQGPEQEAYATMQTMTRVANEWQHKLQEWQSERVQSALADKAAVETAIAETETGESGLVHSKNHPQRAELSKIDAEELRLRAGGRVASEQAIDLITDNLSRAGDNLVRVDVDSPRLLQAEHNYLTKMAEVRQVIEEKLPGLIPHEVDPREDLLYDQKFCKQALAAHPDLLKEYETAIEAYKNYGKSYRDELHGVRRQNAETINKALAEIAKHGGSPLLEVFTTELGTANAAHKLGTNRLFISDAALRGRVPIEQLIQDISHEISHNMQNSLVIKVLANELEIGKNPTEEEISALQKMYKSRVDQPLEREYLLAALKGNWSVSEGDKLRATALIESFSEVAVGDDLRTELRNVNWGLEKLDSFRGAGALIDHALNQGDDIENVAKNSRLAILFPAYTPDQIAKIINRYLDAGEDWQTNEPQIRAYWRTLLLGTQRQLQEEIVDHDKLYPDWAHEQESSAMSELVSRHLEKYSKDRWQSNKYDDEKLKLWDGNEKTQKKLSPNRDDDEDRDLHFSLVQ